MSKLVTGSIQIGSLDDVVKAAAVLGWDCEALPAADGCRVDVPRSEGAYYRPFIDVSLHGGKWQMSFDHMMGLSSLGKDDLDDVTRKVTGQFKQAIALVRHEGILEEVGAQWSVVVREDGARVLTVSR